MCMENQPVSLRVLAIDDEYLIALDVQSIMAELSWCRVDAETTAQFETALSAGIQYDVVIIDPEPLNLTRREISEIIRANGAQTIWSLVEVPEVNCADQDDIPWVLKPFSARNLAAALVKALSARPQPEVARAVAAVLLESGP